LFSITQEDAVYLRGILVPSNLPVLMTSETATYLIFSPSTIPILSLSKGIYFFSSLANSLKIRLISTSERTIFASLLVVLKSSNSFFLSS